MNTKSYLLTGLLIAAAHYTANDNAYTDYNIFRQTHEYRYQADIYASLASPECGSPTELALDSALHRDASMQSQASVLDFSGLWTYAFASSKHNDILDTIIADEPLIETDSYDRPSEGVSSMKTQKCVTIVGSEAQILDYQVYNAQENPRLDIWVSDTVLHSINAYGAKKLGIKLAPSDNIFHIHNKADFQFMTLLLSLGGDDSWNFIHIPNCKQKKQTFDASARLACTGDLRTIACDYLDAYQDDGDNAILFAQSQQRMPGAAMLLLDSYRHFHTDMRTKPDDVVWHAICQTIKRETKNLWLAKMGKKIGF